MTLTDSEIKSLEADNDITSLYDAFIQNVIERRRYQFYSSMPWAWPGYRRFRPADGYSMVLFRWGIRLGPFRLMRTWAK